MGRRKLYVCKPCHITFHGKKAYDAHGRMHRSLMSMADKAAALAESVVPLGTCRTEAATEGDTQWKLF